MLLASVSHQEKFQSMMFGQTNVSCVCSWRAVAFEHSAFVAVRKSFFVYRLLLKFPCHWLDGHPILASASSAGHIALWDLNSGGRLLHMIRGAHDGAISAVEWVPGQPVLVTSGEDNSVKVRYISTLCFVSHSDLKFSNGCLILPPHPQDFSNSALDTTHLLISSDTMALMENNS